MMRNSFQAIPESLRQLATLEGSSELRIIVSMMTPLAMSGLLTVMVFAMRVSWGNFLIGYIFMSRPEMTMLNVGLDRIHQSGKQFDMKWGTLMAGTMISFIPFIVFYTLLQKYFVRGITGSAVKE